MINPNRLYRGKGIITKTLPEFNTGLNMVYVEVNGHEIYGYNFPRKFKVGEQVNIQAQYSITGERYIIKTINRPRRKV